METKKDLIKLIKEAHTKHIINHEEYLGCLQTIDGLNKELNENWQNTNHDLTLDFKEFKKQLVMGKLYENIFYEMYMRYKQELKSQKVQYQQTGNVFIETKNKYSGNWEISRTGLLSDAEDTMLSIILERQDITNNKITYWVVSSLKENWIHEIKRLGLEEKENKDGMSKGYAVPLNQILHNEKDVEEYQIREKLYKDKRIKEIIQKNKNK